MEDLTKRVLAATASELIEFHHDGSTFFIITIYGDGIKFSASDEYFSKNVDKTWFILRSAIHILRHPFEPSSELRELMRTDQVQQSNLITTAMRSLRVIDDDDVTIKHLAYHHLFSIVSPMPQYGLEKKQYFQVINMAKRYVDNLYPMAAASDTVPRPQKIVVNHGDDTIEFDVMNSNYVTVNGRKITIFSESTRFGKYIPHDQLAMAIAQYAMHLATL